MTLLFPENDKIKLGSYASEWDRMAAEKYSELGVPTPKLESWKYTDLRPFKSISDDNLNKDYGLPKPLLENGIQYDFSLGDYGGLKNHIKENGEFRLEGKFHSGPHLADEVLRKRSRETNDPIMLLNYASPCEEHFGLTVEENESVKEVIEVCYVGGKVQHTQIFIRLKEGASATLIERHEASGPRTIVTEIELGTGARLQHYRLQHTSDECVVLATSEIHLGKDSLYDSFALTTGGRLSRHQITATLNGPGGEVRLNGAHVLSGTMHCDTTTEIVHAAPHCRSRETYRHVMDGTSRSVFQGKIFVAQDAQKTDGFQLNQSLMLSPTAEVNAKPELEIYADDVKCSHGATSGRLDEDALFYLRSRGIPEPQARQVLIEAFIGSSIDLIENESVRDAFRAHATKVLGGDK